ncbi:hypothetical protein Hte_005564 [Hypoxylon texense]
MTPPILVSRPPSFQSSVGNLSDGISGDALSATGWPKRLNSPLVWSGADFDDEKKFVLTLSDLEKHELEEGMAYFKSLDLHGSEVNRSNFPLPTLGERLQGLSVELHKGRGFFVLRGLDPAKYSAEDNVLLFLAVASYIADSRGKQDDHGNMLSRCYTIKVGIPRDIIDQTLQEDRPARDSNVKLVSPH